MFNTHECVSKATDAPVTVGEYVAERMPAASLVLLEATGHCPHLSAPGPTIDAINEFVAAKSFNQPDRGLFTAPPV